MKKESIPVILIVGGAAAGVILMSVILLRGVDQAHSPRVPPSAATDRNVPGATTGPGRSSLMDPDAPRR
jgi:hypothetical protein